MTLSASIPDISIVIVTWNGKHFAQECLASLRGLRTPLTLETIVVDNASTDGTPEAIRKEFPEVRLLCNSENLGFAKANNIGIKACFGRYIALINSDVVVPQGCLERMVTFLDQNPGIGLLGPKMITPTGGIGQSVNRLPTLWNYFCCAAGLHRIAPESKWLGGFEMPSYPHDKTEDVEVLTGWFWMSPRRAVEEVGGLDERFFMYGEDIDWSYRFRKAGWRVVFYADAEALHYGGASSGRAPIRFYIEMVRANLQYFDKHHGRIGHYGFLMATAIRDTLRICANCILYCIRPGKRDDYAFKMKRSLACLRWVAHQESLPA
jgi:GT2 family glycosyltransferase